MATVHARSRKCFLCGKETLFREVGKVGESGARDLDTRPAGEFRETMPLWIQKCPECGYVAARIDDAAQIGKEFLSSERFVSCDGIALTSELARSFYRLYLIKRESGDVKNAFWSVLEAAWASDDDGNADAADACRKAALEQLDLLIEQNGQDENLRVLKIDVLRRCGMFDEVGAFYKTLNLTDPVLKRIASFEVIQADAKNAKRHTLDDLKTTPRTR